MDHGPLTMDYLTCIIVDDEPLARKGIELNVKDVDWLKIAGQFPNALQAGDFLAENDVDLMFLDIEMPGLRGLDFLKSLKKDVIVVLTTAYPEFALEAFELEVFDYLVKPIRFERFYKSVSRAREIIELKKEGKSELSDISDEYFYIKADRKYVKLHYKDVLWIKGLKDYVMIYTTGKKYVTAMNVKTIYSKLPHTIFARVSKSYIVNVNTIESIDIDTIMIGREEIPLGNSYKEEFLKTHIRGKLFKR